MVRKIRFKIHVIHALSLVQSNTIMAERTVVIYMYVHVHVQYTRASIRHKVRE